LNVKKTIRTLLPALSLVGALAVYADTAPAPDDSFRVTLPTGYGAFTKQAQVAPSPEGEIKTTNWISKSADGSAVIVTRSEMPGKILDPQKFFDSTRESLLKSLSATLESEERAENGASAHLLFRSPAAFFRSRFEVRDNHFYQLLYVGRSAEARTGADAAQLFDSFAIAETPAAQPPAAATPAVEAPAAASTTQ